jgi:DNA-binding protein HU-beta
MSKRMTKSQIMSELASRWNVSKRQAGEMYDHFVKLAYEEVKRAGEFVMPALGKMAKKHRAARQGRNPATGATIQIPAKTVVKFSVAKSAKEALM